MISPTELLQEFLDGIENVDMRNLTPIDRGRVEEQRRIYIMAIRAVNLAQEGNKFAFAHVDADEIEKKVSISKRKAKLVSKAKKVKYNKGKTRRVLTQADLAHMEKAYYVSLRRGYKDQVER